MNLLSDLKDRYTFILLEVDRERRFVTESSIIILVIGLLEAHILVKKASIFDFYGTGAKVLMTQQNPNMHLSLVKLIADSVEVVVHDFV